MSSQPTKNSHLSIRSKFFENLYQHHFIYEVAKHLVNRDPMEYLTILKAEVDDDGIDLILKTAKVTRHIQLKTLGKRNTGGKYQIKETLSKLPGGCVIWICYDPEDIYNPFCYHFLGKRGNGRFVDLSQYPQALKRAKDKEGNPIDRTGYRNIRLQDTQNRSWKLEKLVDHMFPK